MNRNKTIVSVNLITIELFDKVFGAVQDYEIKTRELVGMSGWIRMAVEEKLEREGKRTKG